MLPHRFEAFVDLSEEERKALKELAGEAQHRPARQTIRRQGDRIEGLYTLDAGWVTSSYDLKDGKRQTVKVHLPGDILGAPSLALKTAGETLTSVTPVIFRCIPFDALASIFREYPRVSALFFLCAQQERVFLMERLSSVGQRNALSRLATLLLHLAERLGLLGGAAVSFELPLRQQELAELLGLTPVHLNRTFQRLIGSGMVERDGRALLLSDISSLRNLAGMQAREWVYMPAWLEGLPQKNA